MKLIKVAAAVLNQTPLDWDNNKSHILQALETARQKSVRIVCLPELCLTGYGCEDAFLSPGTQQTAVNLLFELLPATSGMVVSFGLPLAHQGGLFNAACLAVDGTIAGFVGKQNLAGDGIHYEPRWFKRWPADVSTTTVLRGKRYPLGDLAFDVGGVRLGFEICEDAWVGDRPGADLARLNADIILNPSASHFAFAKHEIRKRFVLEGSRAFNVSYIYANLLGNEAGRAIYDGDAMIATAGHMLATGPRLSFADQHLTTAVVDIDKTRMNRTRTGSYEPDVEAEPENVVPVDFEIPVSRFEESRITVSSWEAGAHVKEEEFTRAVSLGLFDYLRKSRSRGFVVSLSGGADSAATAALAALVVTLAGKELGIAGLRDKLSYISQLQDAATDEACIKALLTCVYQSTRNSGDVTRNAARDVAEALNADFLEFDVDGIVQGYIAIVSQALGRELTWETDDIALQNIQARSRSPGVWMLTNIRNALLLSTSNRSEAAVGYATMDGDTSGGLSPIAGIDKAFLRRWLRWMEETGPAGVGPLPALRAVNVQQPTAELRPPSAEQTDEGDLMPYELLDAIERAAIRDKLTPVEVFQVMEARYAQYDRRQLGLWIDRFFRLWCRNQWKRERYAPSFHLDDENLDPKTWCRFPILSGGFARELEALRDCLDSYEPK